MHRMDDAIEMWNEIENDNNNARNDDDDNDDDDDDSYILFLPMKFQNYQTSYYLCLLCCIFIPYWRDDRPLPLCTILLVGKLSKIMNKKLFWIRCFYLRVCELSLSMCPCMSAMSTCVVTTTITSSLKNNGIILLSENKSKIRQIHRISFSCIV